MTIGAQKCLWKCIWSWDWFPMQKYDENRTLNIMIIWMKKKKNKDKMPNKKIQGSTVNQRRWKRLRKQVAKNFFKSKLSFLFDDYIYSIIYIYYRHRGVCDDAYENLVKICLAFKWPTRKAIFVRLLQTIASVLNCFCLTFYVSALY